MVDQCAAGWIAKRGGPSAKLPACFEQFNRRAVFGQPHGGGKTRQSTADDGDARRGGGRFRHAHGDTVSHDEARRRCTGGINSASPTIRIFSHERRRIRPRSTASGCSLILFNNA